QVNEAGQRDEPGGVDDLGAAGVEIGTDRGDHGAVDEDVHRYPAERAAVADEVSGHRRVLSAGATASNMYSTAIRTATPLVTCSVMTARGESAACAEISNPRFIGPGCMMIARSPRRWARALSSPSYRAYSIAEGKNPRSLIRSACTRSIMIASARSSTASSRL